MKRNLVPIGLLTITLALAATAVAGNYTTGGTFVVKSGDVTIVDNGGAICSGLSGGGIGGGCLPFPIFQPGRDGGAFVAVNDASAGQHVAFQVCIDNNGDGICGGQFLPNDPCPDQIFFSHANGGVFHDPLGPLPTKPLAGCHNAFPGYVVLLCQGEHNDPISGPHTHTLSSGQIYAATNGTGYGDFCGGNGGGTPTGINTNTAAKAYRVV
jgi:hypothetical protein